MNGINFFKNKLNFKAGILFFVLLFSLTACKKETKKDTYKVKYTVDCNGRFKNATPTITFKNESGNPVTETLTINKTWIKEVSGSSKFPMSVKINGTIDSASVRLNVEGSKDGVIVEIGDHGQSSESETDITVKYESTFD